MLTANATKETPARSALLKDFIKNHGGAHATCQPLGGDCSKRSYYRLISQADWLAPSVIAMDAPNIEEMQRFVKTAHFLKEHNLKAPEIYATSDDGFILLEDFGDQTYKKALQQHDTPDVLWDEMTEALIALQAQTPNQTANDASDTKEHKALFPHLSKDMLLSEIELFLNWGLSFQGQALSASEQAEARALWAQFLEPLYQTNDPFVLTLRDFHTENLMRLTPPAIQASRDGQHKPYVLGFLDFQDAVWGPAAYDLVSLLEDVRVPFNAKRAEQLRQSFAKKQTLFPPSAFEEPYAILSLQRATKIFGIFCRLALQDGHYKMLEYLPNICSIIEQRLECLNNCVLSAFFQHLDMRKRLALLSAGL
ncbi:MAG: phosphotransferase [Holosporaceae bacterium]